MTPVGQTITDVKSEQDIIVIYLSGGGRLNFHVDSLINDNGPALFGSYFDGKDYFPVGTDTESVKV